MLNAKQFKQRLVNCAPGPASKAGLAIYLVDGALSLPLRSGLRLRVEESDANFEAKALCALTIARASFQDGPELLDEKAASRALGMDELPSGFYALSPSGRIACAYLPESPSTGNSPAERFAEIRGGLVASGKAEPGTMACRVEFDPARFFAARDPFADFMSIGSGRDERGRKAEREASRDTSLAEFGIRAWTALPGEGRSAAFGYPSAMLLEGEVAKGGHPRPAAQAALVLDDVSMTSRAKSMAALPIHNHDGASEINNMRDIQGVLERSAERGAIADSMADAMLAVASIANGSRDAELEIDCQPAEERDRLRADSARGELKSFGKQRKVFVAQGKTAVHIRADAGAAMVVSMDMALVDGQHSSRDYALIAMGCQADAGSSGPLHWGAHVPDCSPQSLAKRALDRAIRRFEIKGDDPLGLGLAELARAKIEAKPRQAKAMEEEARAKAFAAFARFAPEVPVEVGVSAVSDAEMARMYALIENNHRDQSVESKALGASFAEVQEAVAEFRSAALRRGDPLRVSAVKSLHANPHFSSALSPELLTRDFAQLYPFLRAVADAEKTAGSQTKPLMDKAEAANAGKWEALAVLAEEGYEVKNRNDPVFVELAERASVLLMSIGSLKQRGFELTPKRLPGTLGALLRPERAGPALVKFIKLSAFYAKRILGIRPERPDMSALSKGKEAEDANPHLRSDRIYALMRVAMELKDALRHDEARKGAAFSALMGESAMDNALLTMVMAKYAARAGDPDGEDCHPASPAAVADLKSAKERLMLHHAGDATAFARAREEFKALGSNFVVGAVEWPIFPETGPIGRRNVKLARDRSFMVQMSSPQDRRLIIDAVPGPGAALASVAELARALADQPQAKPANSARRMGRKS